MSNGVEMPIFQLHYLPLIPTFSLIQSYDSILIHTDENYQKQTLRNRTSILTANGVLELTIPVKHDQKKITDVKIDYDQSWVKNHLKSIESAYKHSPFFEYYFPHFQEIYLRKIPLLFTFNLEQLKLIIKVLKISTNLQCELNTAENPKFSRIIYITQHSSVKTSIPYRQVFGSSFIPGLSIIDLIFNMGPDSKQYL
ncbi:MAG: WbqC family protein [Opitutaceae bacterium]|nr:WbqC family protein [Cytophagales bacterium]